MKTHGHEREKERGRKLPQVKPSQKNSVGKGRKKGKKKKKEKKRKKGKKGKKGGKTKKRGGRVVRGGEEKEKEKKKRNDISLCDLLPTDDRNSSEQKTKLVYAIRATHGYRNPNFSSKFQKVGVSPTLVISCLVAMQGSFWFSSNLRAVFIDGQGPNPVFQD